VCLAFVTKAGASPILNKSRHIESWASPFYHPQVRFVPRWCENVSFYQIRDDRLWVCLICVSDLSFLRSGHRLVDQHEQECKGSHRMSLIEVVSYFGDPRNIDNPYLFQRWNKLSSGVSKYFLHLHGNGCIMVYLNFFISGEESLLHLEEILRIST
jgi:hypothetical protein